MRLWFLNAVVGRIAKFPIRGVAWRGVLPPRKGFVTVNYVCNITWGYVAWTVAGEGRGSNSQRGMGLQGVGLGVLSNPTKKGKKPYVIGAGLVS